MSKRSSNQRGGGSTDYAQLFYANSADNAQLSRYTANYINQSPMFNPLQPNTIIPTGTTGIIPTGTYYESLPVLSSSNSPMALLSGPPTATPMQLGGKLGGKLRHVKQSGGNPWITHVKQFAKRHSLNFSQALKHPQIKSGYVSKSK